MMIFDSDMTKNDVFYFLDYSRLILEEEIEYGHHMLEYTKILNDLNNFITRFTTRVDKITKRDLELMSHHFTRDIISAVRDASNHTPLMRAMLRAVDAMETIKVKV